MNQFSPRIHVLMASEAPLGLVIRRGPSKLVATLLWNRETDEFQLGQWLKGRIYARRSDLSPDGKHFIYFAMSGRRSKSLYSWTAISRAPFLKALAIFPKRDCWGGGGLWTSNEKYWRNDVTGHMMLRDSTEVQRDTEWNPSENFGGESLGVYYPRLMRDGWIMEEKVRGARWWAKVIFEKPCPGGWVLRKITRAGSSRAGKGCYWDEHELIHASSGALIACPHWEWAELDGERVVWATAGRLHAGRLATQGLVDEVTLCDFNDMTFTPIEAPY